MSGSAADPNAESGKCADLKIGDDRFEAIVPAGAAPGAHAYGTEWQVDVVHDNNQILKGKLVPVDRFPHRGPAEVHVRPRFEQHDLFLRIEDFDKVGVKAVASLARRMTARELVHNHETEVVPCRGILPTRVPEAYDDLHKEFASHSFAARPRCYTPAAILPWRLILDAPGGDFSQRGCSSHVWYRLPGN